MKTKTNTKKKTKKKTKANVHTLSHHLNLYFGFAPYPYLKLSFCDQIGVQLLLVFSVLCFQKIFRNAQTNKTCKSNHLNNGQSHSVSTDTSVGIFLQPPKLQPIFNIQEKRTKFWKMRFCCKQVWAQLTPPQPKCKVKAIL